MTYFHNVMGTFLYSSKGITHSNFLEYTYQAWSRYVSILGFDWICFKRLIPLDIWLFFVSYLNMVSRHTLTRDGSELLQNSEWMNVVIATTAFRLKFYWKWLMLERWTNKGCVKSRWSFLCVMFSPSSSLRWFRLFSLLLSVSIISFWIGLFRLVLIFILSWVHEHHKTRNHL